MNDNDERKLISGEDEEPDWTNAIGAIVLLVLFGPLLILIASFIFRFMWALITSAPSLLELAIDLWR